MTFTQPDFVVLLLVVYPLWFLCRRNYRAKVFVLITASLVFYGSRYEELVLLLSTYCLVDWEVGRWIVRSGRPSLVLALGVTFNLSVLAYWKYTPMLLQTLIQLAPGLGLAGVATWRDDWVIPYGISFYAFTGIAYMMDVYRRSICAETSFFRFLLYLSFFPHLMAGPILRANDFLSRLQPHCMPDQLQAPWEAVMLLARGFFKKVVLADSIALAIDPFFLHVSDQTTAGVWGLPYVYLYSWQIYFDFSGYTDIARGLALLFGFRWPENFYMPYLAGSVRDFWRRWHITLSRFLKDYLYIPLGGNRSGKSRTYVNVMLTMLLGGLWHGGSWTFMLWGGLHGTYLVINLLWSECGLRGYLLERAATVAWLWRAFCVALTFHCVSLAWCFFRVNVLSASLTCVHKCFVFDKDKLFVGGSNDLSLWVLIGVYGIAALVVYQYTKGVSISTVEAQLRTSALARGFAWGFAITLLVLASVLAPVGEAPPFIYFQF